jgi:hypothetical protein
MSIDPAASSVLVDVPVGWSVDWAWGLPLIVLTILIHVFGLSLLRKRAVWHFNKRSQLREPTAEFVVVIGAMTFAVTILHAAEAGIWALAYKSLGVLPNLSTAMLYSLNAVTSYGHTNISLNDYWHLLGALEALNGWLLFGLSTAFLFGMIQKVWSVEDRKRRE